MQRRDFNKTAAAAAAILTGCGGGGGDGPTDAAAPAAPAPGPVGTAPPAAQPTAAPPTAQAAPVGAFVIGTNIAGMEAAGPGLRFGGSTVPNINIAVPRREDIAWLAANGYTKTRLPIRWEMLQPMLYDTNANAATRAALGEPGAFHPGYESYITGVLDAHAAAGIKCMIDLHNYCRYLDFVYQPDGSVRGLVKPPNPLIHSFTTDATQVRTRIMALAPGATLRIAHFMDIWARIARRWGGHPGLGGYGLMNEPYYMPKPSDTVEAFEGWDQDLTIWPAFAKAAVEAIRGIDQATPIYLTGNNWGGAWTLGTDNPGFPVQAPNIIYDVHGYLDSFSNGNGLDWDLETARNFTSGIGAVPVNYNTGVDRLKFAVDFVQKHGAKLALTETGMPLDDPRWQEAYTRLMNYARQTGTEVYSWAGGSHWYYRNRGINHIPGWHQNKTLEPPMSGPMKAAAGVAKATIFDDGAGWAPGGGSVTITVYARGHLASPVTINVASSNGGSLSKTTLTLAAGANSEDSFTFTPAPNTVATLTYSSASAPNLPPQRKVFSLADPAAYAATSLPDAALAILAKYSACKWELADGYTDYLQGVPANAGQPVRAISDSGYGSSVGNAMEMINWTNTEGGAAMGTMTPPVMRVTNGRKNSDHSHYDCHGFWCRKPWAVPGLQPNPRNRIPYHIDDPHFVIAAVSVPGAGNTGIVFQASSADGAFSTEIAFDASRPQGKWLDSMGNPVTLTASSALAPNVPAVVTITSAPGAQQLRVNGVVQGTGATSFAHSEFGNDQMLLGWGFTSSYPRAGFGGNIYSCITGKGVPSTAELQVLERYLASTAGL
ncbi:MAG: glycoside hydrolase family 5 protein [Ramlibacter sp.]